MKIKYFLISFFLVGLYLISSVAYAEIYKCTGADGKVIFGDQPCDMGKKANVMKQQVLPGSGAEKETSTTNSKKNPIDYKSRPEYAECLKLRNSVADFFGKPTSKTDPNNKGEFTVAEFMGGEKQLAEVRRDMARYKEICSVVDKEGGRELAQQREIEEKPQRDAELATRCQMDRKSLAGLHMQINAGRQSSDRRSEQERQMHEKDLADTAKKIQEYTITIERNCSQK